MAQSPAAGKRKSFLGRMFGSTAKGEGFVPGGGGSMLQEDTTQYDETWYGTQLTRLGKDGVPCTKVATNGKPYERRILIDARNLIVEVRGGRSGSGSILLDDLVDVRRGLSSAEF